MAAVKQLEMVITGKDRGAVATMKALGASADDVKRKVEEINKAKAETAKSLGGDKEDPKEGLEGIAESLGSRRMLRHIVEGGVAGFVGSQLNEFARKAKEIGDEFTKGQIDATGMVVKIGEGLPILGGYISAGQSIRELLLGEQAQIDGINNFNIAINKALDERVALLKESADWQKKFNEALGEADARIKKSTMEGRAREDEERKERQNKELQAIDDKYAAEGQKHKDGVKKIAEFQQQAFEQDALAASLRDRADRYKKYFPNLTSGWVATLQREADNAEDRAKELRAQANPLRDDAGKKKQEEIETQRNIERQRILKAQQDENSRVLSDRAKEDADRAESDQKARHIRAIQEQSKHDAAMLELQGRHAQAEIDIIKGEEAAKIAEIKKSADEEIKRRMRENNESKAEAEKHVDPGRAADIAAVHQEASDRVAEAQKKDDDARRNHKLEIHKQLLGDEERLLQQRVELAGTAAEKIAAKKKLEAFNIKKEYQEQADALEKLLADPLATSEEKSQGMKNLREFAKQSGKEYDAKIKEGLDNTPANHLAKSEESQSLTGVGAAARERGDIDLARQTVKNTAEGNKLTSDLLTQFTQYFQFVQQNYASSGQPSPVFTGSGV